MALSRVAVFPIGLDRIPWVYNSKPFIYNRVGSLPMAAISIRFNISCIHGAFMDPEYLLLSGFGLSSFISGTGSTAFACSPGVLPNVSQTAAIPFVFNSPITLYSGDLRNIREIVAVAKGGDYRQTIRTSDETPPPASSGRPIAIMITALPAPSARGIDLSLYPLPSSSATGKLRYIPSFRFRTRSAPAEAAVSSNGDQPVSHSFGLIWLGDFYAEEERELLVEKYQSHIQKKKQFSDLCNLKQKSSKTLAEYVSKWKTEVMGVTNFNDKSIVPFFTKNVRSGPFHRNLIQYPLKTYTELIDHATRFANVELVERRKKEEEEGRSWKDKAPQKKSQAPRPPCREHTKGPRLTPTSFLTPLMQPVSTILDYAQDIGIVEYPGSV
nr:uncharacterized protein LOC109162732 [Ipomoea batatas]